MSTVGLCLCFLVIFHDKVNIEPYVNIFFSLRKGISSIRVKEKLTIINFIHWRAMGNLFTEVNSKACKTYTVLGLKYYQSDEWMTNLKWGMTALGRVT